MNEKKWESSTVSEIASFVIGGDWGKDPETFEDEEYRKANCIRGSEIKKWSIDKGKTSSTRLVKVSSLEKRNLKIGDILIEISGGGPDQPVGRTVFIDKESLSHNELPNVCTNFLRLYRATEIVSSKFVEYFFKSIYLSGEIRKYQGGSNNLRNLKFKKFETIKVPLPPLPEQKRIVAKLDKVFGHLEDLKKRLDGVPKLLADFRQAVLTQAVKGKLTEDWRKGKSESFAKEELEEIGVKCIGESSNKINTWIKTTIGDYLINEDNKRVPLSRRVRLKRQGNFPYYGATGIIDSIDDYTHDGKYILISEDGKNLLYRSKPISFSAKGKFWVNNHAHILQSRKGYYNEFAIYFFNAIDLTPYITGIDQVKLSQRNLNIIEIDIPPIEEQSEIVRRVESLFTKADKIESQYQTLKSKIDQLPQAILAKAFKGELVPQLASDGDAKDLLAEIKKLKEEAAIHTKKGK